MAIGLMYCSYNCFIVRTVTAEYKSAKRQITSYSLSTYSALYAYSLAKL